MFEDNNNEDGSGSSNNSQWQHSGIDPIALQGKGETFVLGLVDILQVHVGVVGGDDAGPFCEWS
jgi:hypothetical protein